ncbi:MAG: hypothetical protein KatS3mg113_0889 [Planctomycetaceae bacterium]|nr:MAG: hypothetical protein KatS3mg113_0889 [Planctomycetaceae bacterium]
MRTKRYLLLIVVLPYMFGIAGCLGRTPEVVSTSTASDSQVTEPQHEEGHDKEIFPQTDDSARAEMSDQGQEPPIRDAFEQLCRAVELNDPVAWERAERVLQTAGSATRSVLVAYLEDSQVLKRELAVMWLAQLGPEVAPVADKLKNCLHDESVLVRVNAAAALSCLESPSPEVMRTLMELVDADDVHIRLTSLAGLANLGEAAQPALAVLEKALHDMDPRIRTAAAQTLGRLGAPAKSLLPTLKLLASDEDENVREAIQQAVQQIDTASGQQTE